MANVQEEYSNADILNLFYIHGECSRIVDRTCRLFNDRYPHLPPMSKRKFARIESNFLNFGKVKVNKNVPKPVTEDDANQINSLAYFHAHPQSSIPSAEHDLGISSSSIHRILQKNHMHPYSFQHMQAFRPGDDILRTEFCEFMTIKIQEDPQFLSRIFWTDEAKFSREGITNRRNQHFWAEQNPHRIRVTNFQERFSFNVFAVMMDNQLRYLIYEDSLTSQRYLEILRETVIPFLEEFPRDERSNFWYQLDGAPAHSSRNVHLELTRIFEDRWIGPNGPWRWPPRSPDLTPLDFFLWGFIKTEVYSTPVNNLEDLANRVRRAFGQLDNNLIRRSINNVRTRIDKCLQLNGQHIEHLL